MPKIVQTGIIRSAFASAAVIAAAGLLAPRVHAQKGPALADVLKAASDYVMQYSENLKAVSGEEEYLQEDTSGGQLHDTRRMTSDIVLLGVGHGELGTFRDVAVADGHTMNDQRGRLVKIFTDTPDGSVTQAQNISEGSVKHYLTPNLHAFDQPLTGLKFLEPQNQDKVTFKLDSVKNQNGAQIATLKYSEKPDQHVFETPVKGPINGRIQVEMPSGVVRMVEMIVTDKSIDLRSTTTFTHDSATDLWLPSTMDQNLDISSSTTDPSDNGQGNYGSKGSLEGHAKYSKYAKTNVDVSKIR